MSDPVATLGVLIEASIALAGFSGVAAVFGRRGSGEWSAADRHRLSNLLTASFGVLFAALAALLLLSAGVPAPRCWSLTSALLGIGTAGYLPLTYRRAARLPPGHPARPENPAGILIASVMLLALGVQLANAAWIHEFWCVMLGLVIVLAVGSFNFSHLILVSRA